MGGKQLASRRAPARPVEGTLPRSRRCGEGCVVQPHTLSCPISGPVSVLVCTVSLGTLDWGFTVSSLLVFAIPACVFRYF